MKPHDKFCKSKHLITTGSCHMQADCSECLEIWQAATAQMREELYKLATAIEIAVADKNWDDYQKLIDSLRKLAHIEPFVKDEE